jgi:transposase
LLAPQIKEHKTMKINKSQRSRATKSNEVDLLTSVRHPHAAGIDLSAQEAVVAVPSGHSQSAVRTFSTFTNGLYGLRDWLLQCGIKTVALESTGNYWIALYSILEEAGLDVWLVNARHAKAVPGRKTDVCDAQWVQQLHQAGLLRRSFRPIKEVAAMRYLMRHRAEMVSEVSRQLQRMQKVLTEMNLHLHHVFSDIDGQSAQRIIEAILAGERCAERLAQLRDPRCKTPLSRVLAALQGDYREELCFVLNQCQRRREQILESIKECDQHIEKLCAAVPCHPVVAAEGGRLDLKQPTPASHKNSLSFDVRAEALRFYGVDLCEVDGIGTSIVAVLMSEVGPREQLLGNFKSAHAFSSWLGLCPCTRKTAGKLIGSKTRSVSSRLSLAMRLAAQVLGHSKSQLGEYCRRMRGRLGKAEGITAVAHKLARILYAMIQTRTTYDAQVAFQLTPQKKARKIKRLRHQAEQLGMRLVPAS